MEKSNAYNYKSCWKGSVSPQHSKSLHSWFSHLPGISVVYPSSPSEAKGCFMTSIFSNFPTIIFESRSLHAMEEKVPKGNYFVDITKSFIRKKGKDITLVGFGPSINDILDISKQLEKEYKIDVEVLDLRTLNPMMKNNKSVKKIKD